MLEMVYDQTTINAFKFIGLKHNLTISYMKLVIEFVGVDGVEHLSSVVKTGLAELQNFKFHAMDNLFQSLQDVSFFVAVECPPEGEGRVL